MPMPRTIIAVTALLLVTAAAPAQYHDPYRLVAVHGPSYWGYGNLLHGAADVIDAQGRFMISQQQAHLMHEDVEQKKLETSRKRVEHWAWERKFVAQAREEYKEMSHDMKIRYVVNESAPAEIYSGAALNILFEELKKDPSRLSAGASAPLQQEWLPHIHVTSAAQGAGNAGLLKEDKITWPLLLVGRADLAEERTQIENLLNQSKQAVLNGQRPVSQVVELRHHIDKLQGQLSDELRSGREDLGWNDGQYVAAKRSLNELKDVLVLLDTKDAAFYFKPVQGKNVADMVHYMKANGLYFAPATTGDERFYTALYDVMRDELKSVGGVPPLQRNP
jgi:hypothetical protein